MYDDVTNTHCPHPLALKNVFSCYCARANEFKCRADLQALKNEFFYYRMCSLTIECVFLL